MRSTALRWWPVWLLVAGGLLALGTRLRDRELVPYVLDEPQLQDAAAANARDGHWATISVLRGTRGVRYGPAPLWFYTAVHRVAGPRPEVAIVAAGLFLTTAIVLLCVVLARRSEAPVLVLGTGLWLAAASPFAFFWSRLAWDNSLLAGFTALAVATLARAGPVRAGAAALAGVLVGLAVGTHLMAVPFAAAVLWVLARESRPWRERGKTLGALCLAAAVVLAPYLGTLLHEPSAQALPAGEGMGGRLGRALLALVEPFAQTAGLGLGYFFDADWSRFTAETGPGAALRVVGPVVAVVVGLGTLAGLVLGLRAASPGLRRAARIGLWTWVLHAAFLGALALPAEPHYQQPLLWLPVAGWSLAAAALWPGRPRAAGIVLCLAAGVGLWGLGLQRAWMGWIRSNGGTRGIHYGLTLAAQRRGVSEACSVTTPAVALEVQVVAFPQSLRSLARTEPACTGHRVEFCGPFCARVPPGWSVAAFRYAGPTAQLAPVHPRFR